MASTYKRNDGRWVAQYADATGKQRYLYGAKRKEVKQKLEDVLRAQADGLIEDGERLTLGEYLTDWLAATESTVSEGSYLLRVLFAKKHVCADDIANIKLRELSALDIQRFYQKKHTGGMKPQTVRRMHATLSKALSDAVKFKLIGANVARDAERPKVARTEIKPLSAEEIHRLFEAARGDRFEHFYTIAVTCGLRQGENLGLRWEDVDLSKGTLRVRRCIHRCKVKGLKSERSYRKVKLSRRAMAALEEQRGCVDSEWVFPTSTGDHQKTLRHLYKSWYRIKTKADLPTSTRIHDLRHTCATLLLSSGVPLKVVADMLGNDASLCLKVYAHALPSMQGQAADAMDSALG
jgi:integrase